MRRIFIEDTGTLLVVDCPMVQLKVTLFECERCPYHRGKEKATLKETLLGDPQHLFVAGSITCAYPQEPTTRS